MQWLAEQPASIALRESLFVWPLIESTHVLTLAVFVGTAAMLDLRLLGVSFRGVPASTFTARLLPWTRASFALMTVTGLLLFYATPVRNYQNLFFRVKVVLLVAREPEHLAVPFPHPPARRRVGPGRGAAAGRPGRRRGVAGRVDRRGRGRADDGLQLVRLRHPAAVGVGELGGGLRRAAGRVARRGSAAAVRVVRSHWPGLMVRESVWMFPVIEAVHLLGLCMLGGALLVVDLRLLGAGLTSGRSTSWPGTRGRGWSPQSG